MCRCLTLDTSTDVLFVSATFDSLDNVGNKLYHHRIFKFSFNSLFFGLAVLGAL